MADKGAEELTAPTWVVIRRWDDDPDEDIIGMFVSKTEAAEFAQADMQKMNADERKHVMYTICEEFPPDRDEMH